jgi:hypothetical protein
MIRLNNIFGRRPTQDHDPKDGPASPVVLTPPGLEEDWDEDMADAYLLAQEKGSGLEPAAEVQKPTVPQPILPSEAQHFVEPRSDHALIPDRAAMAQQQLAAAQSHMAPAVPIPLDLSGFAGSDPGQTGRRVGRVKTRLLGFDHVPGLIKDPIEAARANESTSVPSSSQISCPVGWIVVIRGPGKGAHFALFNGVSQIGRGEDQAIKLDFGDGSISRTNHAAIAYDDETNGFFLGHGGKTNIVRLNDRPVISTETLTSQDLIRIGETTLLFVALCNEKFRWIRDQTGPDDFG